MMPEISLYGVGNSVNAVKIVKSFRIVNESLIKYDEKWAYSK